MDDALDMTGRAVLVTGRAGGVGRGITEAFLARGADVVICGRNVPGRLPSAEGRDAAFLAADVRDADAVAALIEATTHRLGHLDVVVNNAGGGPPAFVQGRGIIHTDAGRSSPSSASSVPSVASVAR